MKRFLPLTAAIALAGGCGGEKPAPAVPPSAPPASTPVAVVPATPPPASPPPASPIRVTPAAPETEAKPVTPAAPAPEPAAPAPAPKPAEVTPPAPPPEPAKADPPPSAPTAPPAPEPAKPAPSSAIATVRLDVSGMTCPAGCPERVRAALDAVQGTKKVTVDFAAKIVTVDYDPALTKPEEFLTALEKTPYYKGKIRP